MKPHAPRAAVLTAVVTLSSLTLLGAPASAVDDQKPVFDGCGRFVKDNESDATDPVAGNVPQAEIVNAFLKHDPAKGAEATTFNMTIKDLSGTVPPPATSITYDATYGFTADTVNFVRAYLDFTGMVAFEYGHTEPLGASTRYAYDGDTPGKLFTGANGVVQIVIPPDLGGKAGATMKGVTPETQLGRTTFVPAAVNQSPSRGLSFQNDTAGLGNYTAGACSTAPAAPGIAPGTGTGTGTQSPPPAGGSSTEAGPLPVKLVTKRLKRAKAKKTVAIRVRASEALTAIGARLSRGRTVLGTGKLSRLSGNGTLKIKLKKALKKGSYALDVAGNDAQKRRRIVSFKLSVK